MLFTFFGEIYPVDLKGARCLWTVKGALWMWDIFKIPVYAFLHHKKKWFIVVQRSIVLSWYTLSVEKDCVLSIISSDCTFKITTKGNQFLLFFALRCFLPPSFTSSHDSVLCGNVWVYFLCSSLVCFSSPVSSAGGLSGESATAHLRVGSDLKGGKQWNAASNLPAEPVAAFHGLKHNAVQDGGSRAGQTAGQRSTPNIDTDSTQIPNEGQIHRPFRFSRRGLVVFTQIKSFGHNDETTQGAYLSLTQL